MDDIETALIRWVKDGSQLLVSNSQSTKRFFTDDELAAIIAAVTHAHGAYSRLLEVKIRAVLGTEVKA